MNTRTPLIGIALAFGLWEAADSFDTGAPAIVFSVLFLSCVAWLSLRVARTPAVVIALLCTVEATQAHTWKNAGQLAKDAGTALGTAGILAAAAYLVTARRQQEVER